MAYHETEQVLCRWLEKGLITPIQYRQALFLLVYVPRAIGNKSEAI